MTLQTADRALQVLQQFHAPADALSVTEIADRLGIHRSTASRLVSTLRARGFLEEAGDLVRLGPEVARLGTLAGRELAAIAQPLMERLAARTGETVTLGVVAAGETLTVAQAGGRHVVSAGNWVGLRTPVHCTADGKVLLAFGAATLPSGLERRTKHTIVDPAALERELHEARARGYAIAEGELEPGLVGVAAPVLRDGACVAALCISGPEYRLDRAVAHELAAGCIEHADVLSAAQ